jgi:hypothetical protein
MRWLPLALVALGLCSCGKKAPKPETPPDPEPEPTPTVPNRPAPSKPEVTALYQFWDSSVNEHVYSYGDGEPANWRRNPDFKNEKIIGYVATQQYAGTVPLYRAYCKDRRHYFYLSKPAGANDVERMEAFTVYVWKTPGDGRVPVHACFLPDDKDACFDQDLKRIKDYVDGTLKQIGKQRKLVENYFYVYPTGSPARPGTGTGDPKPPSDPYLFDWWELPADRRAPLVAAAKKAFGELKKLGVETEEIILGEGYFAALDERFVTTEGKIRADVLRELRLLGVSNLKVVPTTRKGTVMFSDAGVAELDQLRCLHSVYLGWADITDAGLAGFKNLKALSKLALGNTIQKLRITGDGLKHLQGLPELAQLEIRGASITDVTLKPLTQLPHLFDLDLSKNPITDAGLQTLAACPNLKKLRLTSGPGLTDAGVERLEKAKPELEVKLGSP